MTADTTGRRIWIVEDEMLIAIEIKAVLKALDCEIVGPTSKLDAAMLLADDEPMDAAILDINIRGGKSYPIAERLLSRGVPFALASGYGDWALPEELRGQLRLTKPFTAEQLETLVRSLCAQN